MFYLKGIVRQSRVEMHSERTGGAYCWGARMSAWRMQHMCYGFGTDWHSYEGADGQNRRGRVCITSYLLSTGGLELYGPCVLARWCGNREGGTQGWRHKGIMAIWLLGTGRLSRIRNRRSVWSPMLGFRAREARPRWLSEHVIGSSSPRPGCLAWARA